MEEIRKLVEAKLNELLKLGGYPKAESKGEFLVEKLKQTPLMLGNIWQFSIEKFNQIIPPEKINKSKGELLKQISLILGNIWQFSIEKFNQIIPPEKINKSKGELLKQISLILGNIWQFSIEKFNQIIPPKKRSVFQESIGNYLVETLNQLIQISKSRFNQILPPEVLQQWAHVGLTRLLPISLVLFCLYLYCSKPGGGSCKMMKAPGRKGTVMPRATFVGNPSGYFHDLHAMKKKK